MAHKSHAVGIVDGFSFRIEGCAIVGTSRDGARIETVHASPIYTSAGNATRASLAAIVAAHRAGLPHRADFCRVCRPKAAPVNMGAC